MTRRPACNDNNLTKSITSDFQEPTVTGNITYGPLEGPGGRKSIPPLRALSTAGYNQHGDGQLQNIISSTPPRRCPRNRKRNNRSRLVNQPTLPRPARIAYQRRSSVGSPPPSPVPSED